MKPLLPPLLVAAALLISPMPCLSKEPTLVLTRQEIDSMSTFSAVVKRNWKRWSQGNASVSKLDLIAQVARHEYRGEDAAALVALETYLRKVSSVDMDTAAAIENEKIIKVYQRNVLKLRRVKRTIYANGRPTFELLQQGPPGDCYFFSATGWMAKNRPSVIMDSIMQLEDGRYAVRFPNGDQATVTTPTDAELAINDSDSTLQDGLWMSILEKATGVIQQRSISRSANLPDPTVAIDIPGVPIASTVERWTGNETKKYPLGRRANREHVRNGLIAMHKHNRLATALLLHRPPAKLAFDHVYAIMDFNPETDTLTIWNPWGTDFTPDGPSGPENGYERKKGIFYLSLDEFISFFSFLAIEHK